MHVEKSRKNTRGFAAGSLVFCIVNVSNYGGNPEGIFTFLYIGTILAIFSQIVMLLATVMPEDKRQGLMKHSMILALAFFAIDIVFAIPSIQWISRFIEYKLDSAWVFRWIIALALQVISSICFFIYGKAHHGGNHGAYIAAPHGIHH